MLKRLSNISKATLIALLYICFKLYTTRKVDEIQHERISSQSLNRRKKKRPSWEFINKKISDMQFRRMFRMNRATFKLLCQTITAAVGESEFKSENYIKSFLETEDIVFNRGVSMYHAHKLTSGGYIPGEVKLAITLRLLAGGSALDLAIIFDINEKHCIRMFTKVLKKWIILPNIGKIDINSYINDDNALQHVSQGFSKRSNGLLKGAIGAIDGWLIKIQRPTFTRDGITHSKSFFSRKGFYALNVQCVVDNEKRVLWASYSNRGSSHDSPAFRSTNLYNATLKKFKDKLYRNGFFILGDSAYAIESFILPPYDNAKSKSPEDAFNFFHSSARITVECTFGELDRRWGIFWKPICYSLDNTCLIIEGAMHLHNFLVNERLKSNCRVSEDRVDSDLFHNERVDCGITSNPILNDPIRPAGRPSSDEIECRRLGIELRDYLRDILYDHNMVRPSRSDYNQI